MIGDCMLEAVKVLRSARRLIVFTGAGVSAECGIPSFRDETSTATVRNARNSMAGG